MVLSGYSRLPPSEKIGSHYICAIGLRQRHNNGFVGRCKTRASFFLSFFLLAGGDSYKNVISIQIVQTVLGYSPRDCLTSCLRRVFWIYVILIMERLHFPTEMTSSREVESDGQWNLWNPCIFCYSYHCITSTFVSLIHAVLFCRKKLNDLTTSKWTWHQISVCNSKINHLPVI